MSRIPLRMHYDDKDDVPVAQTTWRIHGVCEQIGGSLFVLYKTPNVRIILTHGEPLCRVALSICSAPVCM